MRLAILGGSFNPIHIGHLALADEVLHLGYDKVLFVPTFIPPHKEFSQKISPDDRLKMLSLALKKNEGFLAEPCEIERGGISYTIDTVNFLQKKYGEVLEGKFALVMGEEIAAEFHKWKNAEEIAKKCDLLVAKRADVLENAASCDAGGRSQNAALCDAGGRSQNAALCDAGVQHGGHSPSAGGHSDAAALCDTGGHSPSAGGRSQNAASPHDAGGHSQNAALCDAGGHFDAAADNVPCGGYAGGVDEGGRFLKITSAFKWPHKMISNFALPISSSDIRKRILEKKGFRYFLPNSVYEYILKNGLYGHEK